MTEIKERRAHNRYYSDISVLLTIRSCPENQALEEESIICSMVEMSPEGVRLLLDKDLPAGTQLECLVAAEDQQPHILVGESRWSKESENKGLFWMGIRLTGDPAAQLAAWHALFPK